MMELNSLIEAVTAYAGAGAEKPLTVAYDIAKKAHEGYYHLDSEPYINHSLAVAKILADWRAPTSVVVVGLLHDILTSNLSQIHSLDVIQRHFTPETLSLLDAISNLNSFIHHFETDFSREGSTRIEDDLSRDAHANIILHEAFSFVHAPEAFIIKIADRLHNLQIAMQLEREYQRKSSATMLNIFAPLADRFGMGNVKHQMEDLSFKLINPAYYALLEHYCAEQKLNLEINDIVGKLQQVLRDEGQSFEVFWQPFSLYTIYHRQIEESARHGLLLHEGALSLRLEDIGTFVILTDNDTDCYVLLGFIHAHYPSVDKQWHDFVSHPRENGYHSLHTQVNYTTGHHINLIIRSHVMNLVAANGYTALWQNSYIAGKYLPTMPNENRPAKGEIVLYTPKGEMKYLPQGSTLVDFAYDVHTDVGDHCVGGLVNGVQVDVFYVLRNGETVEIIVGGTEAEPRAEWLKHVLTPHAQNRIRHWLMLQHRNEMEERGRTLVDRALQPVGMASSDHEIIQLLTRIALKEKLEGPEDVLVSVGVGRWTAATLVERLQGMRTANFSELISSVKVLSSTDAELSREFARCCHPMPPDEIIGYRRNNHLLIIHGKTCPRIQHIKSPVTVQWDTTPPEPDYVIVVESANRAGVVAEIIKVVASLSVDMQRFDSHKRTDSAMMETLIYLGHTTLLQRDSLQTELEKVAYVKSVESLHISDVVVPPQSNPYGPGPAVGSRFYGREAECQRIDAKVRDPGQNSAILLWGQNRIGKTSLLFHLEEQTWGEFLPVITNLQSIACCSTLQFLQTLIHTIYQRVKAAYPGMSQEITMPHFTSLKADPIGCLDRFLAKVQEGLNHYPLILILDEFQYLYGLREDGINHISLFGHLCSLAQYGQGLHLVLSGSGMLSTFLNESGLSELLSMADVEPLGRLKEDDASRLVRDGLLRVSSDIDDDAVDYLLRVTACHPYFLQLLCYKLFDEAQEQKVPITQAFVSHVMDQWITHADDSRFQYLWATNKIADTQRNKVILSAIAQLTLGNQEVTYQKLHHTLRSFVKEQDLVCSLNDLSVLGVLKHVQLKYAIEVELLALWLRQHWPLVLALKEADLS